MKIREILFAVAMSIYATGCVGMTIGDSITWGACPFNVCSGRLPERGWPEKTAILIKNFTLVNRAIPGSYTAPWLGSTAAGWAHQAQGQTPWTDVPTPTSPAEPFGASVFQTGSTNNPGPSSHGVLVMLGTNDRVHTGDTPAVAFERYKALIALLKSQQRANGGNPVVIPLTLLTANRRCDLGGCDVPWIITFNDLIRAEYTNEIDIDTEFYLRGGSLACVPDGLHPNCACHNIIASIVADALVARGLAAYSNNPLPVCTTP